MTGKQVLLNLRTFLDFTNIKDVLDIKYEVTCGKEVIERGAIIDRELLDIHPHEKRSIPIMVTFPINRNVISSLIMYSG